MLIEPFWRVCSVERSIQCLKKMQDQKERKHIEGGTRLIHRGYGYIHAIIGVTTPHFPRPLRKAAIAAPICFLLPSSTGMFKISVPIPALSAMRNVMTHILLSNQFLLSIICNI